MDNTDMVEAPETEQPTEQTATVVEIPSDSTPEEIQAIAETVLGPDATPAKAKRKRTRTAKPKQEPVVEEPEEAPARTYTAWEAPTDREAAQAMLRPAKGRGLILELKQAGDRVTTNRNRKDAGPKAPNTIQAIGWHDRTVAKVLTALGIVGTPSAKREAGEVLAAAQKHTGFGTAKAITRPGKQAFAALEAANSRKRPARTATAKEVAA